MDAHDQLVSRAEAYCQRHARILGKRLGFGVHGTVFVTKSQPENAPAASQSAIKIHHRETDYQRERDVYLRLRRHGVKMIRGCHVPQLLRHDDELWIIEMTVVTRPFVLDFAGAFLDHAPDFSEEVLAEWHAEKQEQFGAARWREAQAVVRALQQYGVNMVDVTPNNIALDA
jgi:hypothetical protein